MRVLKSLRANKNTESPDFAWLWMKVRKGMASSRQELFDFCCFFLIFILCVRKSLGVAEACAIAHLESFFGNPRDTRPSSNFLPVKNDRAIGRASAQSSGQRKLHVPAWIWFRVLDLSRRVQQPGHSAPYRNYAKTGEQRGGWALPRLHPRCCVTSAEGLRLVVGTHAPSRGKRAEGQTSCKTADERVYGLGSGGAEEACGPVSTSAQRWAQQDSGQIVAVSRESHSVALAHSCQNNIVTV